MPASTNLIQIMKAKFLFILIFSLLTTCGYSKVNSDENPLEVSLILYKVNKHQQTGNNPRNPELSVSILDHTLFFSNVEEDYTLTIYDGNGIPVYISAISSATTQIDLPDSLFGDYILRLDTDDYYYEGDIYL